ncbi:MAG: hypothetical protein K5989_03295 [Lachnospiraceae bacterium]|nr:hypothetical protein [Lachnospiraceae bacterium]
MQRNRTKALACFLSASLMVQTAVLPVFAGDIDLDGIVSYEELLETAGTIGGGHGEPRVPETPEVENEAESIEDTAEAAGAEATAAADAGDDIEVEDVAADEAASEDVAEEAMGNENSVYIIEDTATTNATNNYPNLWGDGITKNSEISDSLLPNASVYQSANIPTIGYDSTKDRLVFIKGAKYDVSSLSENVVVENKKYFNLSKKGILKAKKETAHEYLKIGNKRYECAILNPTIANITNDTTYNVGDVKSIKLNKGMSIDDFDKMGMYVEWSTAKPEIAFVSNNNIYMAGQGSTTVYAKVAGRTFKKKVKVSADNKLSNRYVFLAVGQKKTIYHLKKESSSSSDEGDKYKKKKVTSLEPANTDIAETTDSAIVGIAPGYTTVKAFYYTNSEQTKYAEVNIQVYVEDPHLKEDSYLSLTSEKKNKYEYQLNLTEGQQYAVTAEGIDFEVHKIPWKANKKSKAVAAVNDVSTFCALKAGVAKYSAKIDGKTVKLTINVTAGDYDTDKKLLVFEPIYGTEPYPQLLNAGEKGLVPSAPETPTSGYYAFEGWIDSAGTKYAAENESAFYSPVDDATAAKQYFQNPVSDNMTLYGNWVSYKSSEVISITFHYWDADGANTRKIYVKKGDKIDVCQVPRVKPTALQSCSANTTGTPWTESAAKAANPSFKGWGTVSSKKFTEFDFSKAIESSSAIDLYPIYEAT